MPLVTNPAWAPAEPHSALLVERSQFIGLLLAWGAWGILVAVTIHCVRVLWRNVRQGKRRHIYLLVYVLLVISLATAGLFLATKWTQTWLIDQRNYPGGPVAYYEKFNANPITTGERVCDFMVNWLADGLLTYRVYVIYEGRLLFVALPILTFLASFSLSIIELYLVSRPGSSILLANSVKFGLAYWSLSVAVNVIVTILIVLRLFAARRTLAKAMGTAGRDSGELYTNVSAILVESAAIYTIPAIIFLVGYGVGDVLNASVDAVEVIQGIAPLLIILRVANGSAYSATTISDLTDSSGDLDKRTHRMASLRFASHVQSSTGHSEQTEDLTSKDERLAVPVILMDSDDKGARSSVQSISPYPTTHRDSDATALKNGRHLSTSPSTTGLRIGHNRTVSPVERHERIAAYVSAWRGLEWRRTLRIPFPPADATQIHATRLPSPLRGVARQNITRHLPSEVRAWALDTAQDLLLFIEQNEDGPPYPVHCISTKTGRRHPRAARLPSLHEEEDPWLASNEDVVRIHGLLAGVVHAGCLRVYEWRTGNLLLEVPCLDDFTFLDSSHVLLTQYDPDTLLPSIILYPLSHDQPDPYSPAYRFNLPRLRSALDGAEVFVRLAADSPPPTSRFGAFYADPSPNHRALFIRLEVFTLSDPNNSDDHASTLCVPLGFFMRVIEGTWNSLNVLQRDEHGTAVIQWHIWGPPTCGLIPPTAGAPSEPGVFGCRAARVIPGSNLRISIPFAQTTSPIDVTAVEDELARFTPDPSDVFLEVFDFHPGRVALARATLVRSQSALNNARRDEIAAGADVRADDVLSAMDLDVGTWSIQKSGHLDTRIWDVSPFNSQTIETDIGAASQLQLPYILTRRRVPTQYVLGENGGKAILTEDAVLYVPVRDFVTGEPEEYVAFVF
ncbi:unnamed protein product [Peniophora sp. CBMAI 1063]|nr:unnamed protein product [Peniophora sp. CBMAI 1063]